MMKNQTTSLLGLAARESQAVTNDELPIEIETHLALVAGLYAITAADVEARRAEFAAITCTTPDGYEDCRLAIAHCRTTRVAIEERRKELKADSLEFGRRVDRVAKDLTALIEGLEDPLRQRKEAVDEEKAEKKRAAERAEREAIEAVVRAQVEAENAAKAAEAAALAEQDRILRASEAMALAARKEVLRAEAEALEMARTEQAAAQAKIAEANRIEAERLAAEQAAIDERRREVERLEFERLATIRAEEKARKDAADKARDDELARLARERQLAEIEARREAMKPDREKLHGLADALDALVAGVHVTSDEAKKAVNWCAAQLGQVTGELREFCNEEPGEQG